MVDIINRHKTGVDLSDKTLDTMGQLLNTHLATSFDLYSQTKQAHWNVKGMHFIALHQLFDTLAESILEYVDMIAERATALGADAMGTARMSAQATELAEFPMNNLDGQVVLEAMIDRYSAYGNLAREAIDAASEAGDEVTTDLFTEITRGMDKHLYFLQSHLS